MLMERAAGEEHRDRAMKALSPDDRILQLVPEQDIELSILTVTLLTAREPIQPPAAEDTEVADLLSLHIDTEDRAATLAIPVLLSMNSSRTTYSLFGTT